MSYESGKAYSPAGSRCSDRFGLSATWVDRLELEEHYTRMPSGIEPARPCLLTTAGYAEGQQQVTSGDGEHARLSRTLVRPGGVDDVERHRLAGGIGGPITGQRVARTDFQPEGEAVKVVADFVSGDGNFLNHLKLKANITAPNRATEENVFQQTAPGRYDC